MNKLTLSIIILFLLIMTACDSQNPTPAQPSEPIENNNSGVARPTPTPENKPSQSFEFPVPYPGVPTPAILDQENYPAPKQISTRDPYPANANTSWILFPVGVQCEDTSTSKHPNEQSAQADLTAAGIPVHTITTTELMVCSACGCPTSVHYRAEINEADIGKAISLGWVLE